VGSTGSLYSGSVNKYNSVVDFIYLHIFLIEGMLTGTFPFTVGSLLPHYVTCGELKGTVSHV